MMSLNQLQYNQRAIIKEFKSSLRDDINLLSRGIYVGCVVVFKRSLIFKNIHYCQINGALFCFKNEDAQNILVEIDQPIIEDDRGVKLKNVISRALVIGQPNVGKSSLLNFLAESNLKVGNWSGVTVDKKKVNFVQKAGGVFELIDTPGFFTLTEKGEDRDSVRKLFFDIQSESYDFIIHVIDACFLERGLTLHFKLRELKLPIMVVITMNDLAKRNKIDIDFEQLRNYLQIPVIENYNNASDCRGLFRDDFLKSIRELQKIESLSNSLEYFGKKTEFLSLCHHSALNNIKPAAKRLFVLEALSNNDQIISYLIKDKKNDFKEALNLFIETTRINFRWTIQSYYLKASQKVLEQTNLYHTHYYSDQLTQKFDRVILHRFFSIPILIVILWFMFKGAVTLGTLFQDYITAILEFVIIQGLGSLLNHSSWMKILFVDGLGYGFVTVVGFAPLIFFLFFFIKLLDQIGYLPRIGAIMMPLLSKLGLPGNIIAPMLLGFGCNVPSFSSFKILHQQEEKKIAGLMSPFFSCSARLPVYLLLAVEFFNHLAGVVVISLYFFGLFMAILVGLFARRFIYKHYIPSDSIIDLPSYRRPNLKVLVKNSWSQMHFFFKRSIKGVLGIILLFQVLANIPYKAAVADHFKPYSQDSMLGRVGLSLHPLLSLMGIQSTNWSVSLGILNGFLAKELVVSSMILGNRLDTHNGSDLLGYDLNQMRWEEYLQGITNIVYVSSIDLIKNMYTLIVSPSTYIPFLDILEFDTSDLGHQINLQGFGEQHSNSKIQHQLAQLSAYSLLLFILLYLPCVSMFYTVGKGISFRFAILQAIFQTFLAFMISIMFYQIIRYIILL